MYNKDVKSLDYKTLLKRAPRVLRVGLNLASSIVPKLPQKGDSPLQVVVKCVAILDSLREVIEPKVYRKEGLRLFLETYHLVETKNEQFVSLFFETDLYSQFEVLRFPLNDYTEVIECSHAQFGRIFFVEYSYSSGPEPFFYHKAGLDFADILRGLWETYEGRLHVTVSTGEFGKTKSQYTSFKEGEKNPLYGGMRDQMEALIARHRRFAIDEVPRSYLFFGEPGTGKTSCAMVFADRIGERILQMDAISLSFIHVKDIVFLLENLRPDFLIINDVDKADVSKGVPTVLEVLERFKVEYPWVSVLMTANTTTKFDLGMLRPGRIDTWVRFQLPQKEERREILDRYLEKNAISALPSQLETLVEMTEGLSQDYLREIALELKYDDFAHVTGNIQLRQDLLKAATTAAAPPSGAPQAELQKAKFN